MNEPKEFDELSDEDKNSLLDGYREWQEKINQDTLDMGEDEPTLDDLVLQSMDEIANEPLVRNNFEVNQLLNQYLTAYFERRLLIETSQELGIGVDDQISDDTNYDLHHYNNDDTFDTKVLALAKYVKEHRIKINIDTNKAFEDAGNWLHADQPGYYMNIATIGEFNKFRQSHGLSESKALFGIDMSVAPMELEKEQEQVVEQEVAVEVERELVNEFVASEYMADLPTISGEEEDTNVDLSILNAESPRE